MTNQLLAQAHRDVLAISRWRIELPTVETRRLDRRPDTGGDLVLRLLHRCMPRPGQRDLLDPVAGGARFRQPRAEVRPTLGAGEADGGQVAVDAAPGRALVAGGGRASGQEQHQEGRTCGMDEGHGRFRTEVNILLTHADGTHHGVANRVVPSCLSALRLSSWPWPIRLIGGLVRRPKLPLQDLGVGEH